MQHTSFKIDEQVVDNGAHTGEGARDLRGGGTLLGSMHSATQAYLTQARIHANRLLSGARIPREGHRQVACQSIITDKVILDLQQAGYAQHLIIDNVAAQGTGAIAIKVKHAIQHAHRHPLEIDMQGCEIKEDILDLLLQLRVRTIGRQRLEDRFRNSDDDTARLQLRHVLLLDQGALSWPKIVRHAIGKLAARGVNGGKVQLPLRASVSLLHGALCII